MGISQGLNGAEVIGNPQTTKRFFLWRNERRDRRRCRLDQRGTWGAESGWPHL